MNLTASVLELSRADIKALRVTDPYSLHRVVYSLYADVRSAAEKRAGQTSGILYADQGGDFKSRKILLLANREPATGIVNEQGDAFGKVRSKSIPFGFLEHEHYRFKVIINPTRRNSASRKLLPVKGRDDIAGWFLERASRNWGFEVSARHLQVDRLEVLQFKDKAQHIVTLAQAHVQGQLTVADRTQFQNSFTNGVGRGRAFGCGLLQIVPIIDNPFA